MYLLKQKKNAGVPKKHRLCSQVPHKLREIDVSMVKVVSTPRRAVCILNKLFSALSHVFLTFSPCMP